MKHHQLAGPQREAGVCTPLVIAEFDLKNVRCQAFYLRRVPLVATVGWTRQFGSPEWDSAFGVAVDRKGNIYIADQTQGTLPGQSGVSGADDAFLRKYDPAVRLP